MPRIAVGRRSGDHSNDPLWFTAGYAPKKKQYSLVLSVDPETHKAVASRLAATQPWLVHKSELDKAHQHAQNSYSNLEQAKLRLRNLEEKREQALQDVQQVRQAELDRSLAKVESSLKEEYQEKLEKNEQQWKAEIESLQEKLEEERSAKRKREQEVKADLTEQDENQKQQEEVDASLVDLERRKKAKSDELKVN